MMRHLPSVINRADGYLSRLIDAQPRNLYDAFEIILTCKLATSYQDRDIMD